MLLNSSQFIEESDPTSRSLLLAIINQCLIDIEGYKAGYNRVSRYDYLSSIAFFEKGGGLDEYLLLFGIEEDCRFKRLRERVLAPPLLHEKPPRKESNRPRHYVRHSVKTGRCAVCNEEFTVYGVWAKYCPIHSVMVRKMKAKESNRAFRAREREKRAGEKNERIRKTKIGTGTNQSTQEPVQQVRRV